MNVPKQSMPVSRILPSISYSSQFGVNPSIRLDDIVRAVKRLFKSSDRSDRSPGTCACEIETSMSPDILGEVSPIMRKNQCSPGFAPQCNENVGCRCEDRGQIRNGGKAKLGL
jgi:hypothetical protein